MEPITVRIMSRDFHLVQRPFRSTNWHLLWCEPEPGPDHSDGRNGNTEDSLGIGGLVVAVIRVAGDCKPDSTGLPSYASTGLNDTPVERTEHRKDVDEAYFGLIGNPHRLVFFH